jgi:hypothetical protein
MKLDKGWEEYAAAIDPEKFTAEMRVAMRRTTELNSLFMIKTIKRFMKRRGSYSPNAELTLNLKRSSKPLIGIDATLFNSVAYKVIDDFTSFVGIKRGARNREGKELVDLGAGIHEGMRIPVTERMRNLFRLVSRAQRGQVGHEHRTKKGRKAKHKGAGLTGRALQ